MRQLILDLLPDAAPSLDNFVAGSNGEALACLHQWQTQTPRETCLFLWGDAGAGKTHLLRAVGVRYIDATTDPALATLAEDDTRAGLQLAVDNVAALDAAGQIALFNAFNRLRASGGALLVAAPEPPLRLTLREDLRTRLGSGLICRLQPLTDAEKIAALATQAAARGVRLPPEVLTYLLARAPRDMRSLSALLASLDRYSLEHKRPITLPLLREVLHARVEA
ncbi:DnaA regulatory inactivator Hda [Rhodocyclus tenuis]|uniref:DnaA regulatory inactivator Hda n=2 Tax=Rhodocyclus TaxID=1064 RepID=A0A6L5JWI7_RHOTE|nr:DnaA regulatory inactivator Hda [Rhodocyclus gracilis]MQY51733.1 DnaA regulatory inactivator Hda [Rhodocyclus gracilis]MRD73213.1 DnaA regulatory inactivator Hda [Rhodocyclus gracilis]NJA89006.1 DnaA regulatory inactivator Hda [Rhodocyclus gracilis]